MKKKKILFLITKSNWGGAQRYVFDLATNLPTEFEAVVALGGDGPLKSKLEQAGIKVLSIPGLQRDISLPKEVLSMWHIANIIRSEDPAVLHINSSKAGALGAFLGRILFVPRVIFTSHGWAFNENRSKLSKLFIKTVHWLTVIFSHQTIAVSHNLKSQLTWPGAQNKMVVIHNGRNIPHFYDKKDARSVIINHCPALKTFSNDFWSVSLGELHTIKGHDVAIKALSEVVKNNPSVRHVIISSGQERMELEALVHELKLANHVFFTGAIDEAAQYLRAFDLFILPSRSEALAYVVIEACFAGLPIIASRVGGIPEIITSLDEGILVEKENPKEITNAYNYLYQNNEKRLKMADSAKKRALYFTTEKMVTNTTKFYVH